MLTYFLARQADGRIVLDRELHGSLLKTIEVAEPAIVRREIDGEMVECPQYWESFCDAIRKVRKSDYVNIRGEGWFDAAFIVSRNRKAARVDSNGI